MKIPFPSPSRWLPRPVRAAVAIGAAVAVAGLLVLAAAGPAQAVAAPDCKTAVSHLVDRPDNGHGTPSTWALDTVTRTVKVCHVEDTPAPAVAKAVPIDTWTYTATLVDEGTFVTKGGATGSPNAGVAIAAGMKGTIHGEATFAKFTAMHDFLGWVDAFDGKTFTGSAPSGTNDWIKNLWSDGFGGTQITNYKWTYTTCSEKWVDSSEESNGDGTADSAGDITGKACPSPSVSASPAPSLPGSASGVPIVGQPTLPVTGSRAVLVAGVGAVLVAIGAAGVIVGRRRRRDPVFTAE